ncbi:MAG: hypothetical protein SOI66_05340 [Bifidobacterium sp.]|jgi:hypothetical protein
MNAAEYLLSYFEASSAAESERNGFHFPDIVAALEEIESTISQWDKAGMDVTLMRDCMERWKLSALRPFTSTDAELHWEVQFGRSSVNEALSPGDLMGLQVVADKMKDSSLHFTEEQCSRITHLITEARKSLGGISDTLPEGLALYLSRLMGEVETAIDEYSITGDFGLEKAFCRLREGLDVAMSKTPEGDSGRWDGVKSVLHELAIGFIIEAPSITLAAAQLFPQIGS